MDSVTHIVLGACIGEVVAGKKLGKRAMLLGAIAQSIPDIDVVASLWMNPASDLLAHRGFTHSILFAILAAALLGSISYRLQRRTELKTSTWIFFWGGQIFVHIFIDAFNVYGTGWFEPFSHYRVSFNTIFVADPMFTIWPVLVAVVLLILRSSNAFRIKWARFGILMCGLYLLACITSKQLINSSVNKQLQQKHLSYLRYFSTPTPLNSMLWYVVIQCDSCYYTAYMSIFDRDSMTMSYVPQNSGLLMHKGQVPELTRLIRFSKGYYSLEKRNDTLVFNDLRFGRIGGWYKPDAPFTFFYYLEQPGANDMVIQRGRLHDFSETSIKALFQRIKGN